MSEDKVPVIKFIQNERLSELMRCFAKEWDEEARFAVRVPGRVNLIGEHVDYCGFPVLPMALEQDVLIAIGVAAEPTLSLRNSASEYEPYECALSRARDFDERSKPCWYDYVLSGIRGAMEYLDDKEVKGVKMYVGGNIPPASGLSSSSALVSAACLGFLHAHGVVADKAQMAALCARSERYIGTQGGGMDQAIAFLAKKGNAQYITWEPLAAEPVPLPADVVFVVAHSLTRANKAATSDFNQRVVECRLAAAILAKCNGVSPTNVRNLAQVADTLKKSLYEMSGLVKRQLPLDAYERRQVCELLEMEERDVERDYLTADTAHLARFKLRQRATHVFEEALRVEKFRAICLHSAGSTNCFGRDHTSRKEANKRHIEELGALMRSSHSSLEELYECSHASLDRLVRVSDEAGVHARLTGAGWGGCVVALCRRTDVARYISLLKRTFYSHLDNCDQFVFETTPNDGAAVYIM